MTQKGVLTCLPVSHFMFWCIGFLVHTLDSGDQGEMSHVFFLRCLSIQIVLCLMKKICNP